MCGIAGEFNFNKQLQNKTVYQDMQKVLKRRGPNQKEMFISDEAAFVHTRLAVIDVEGGKQPMISNQNNQKTVLTYNGELYNTEEIKEELLAMGYQFDGHSDTEVVLKSYLAFGERCVEKMNGIFAFAIYDEAKHSLFIARDRMGVKPFFYIKRKDYFLFASEIKALLVHPEVKPILDLDGIYDLICIGPGRTPGQAVFKDIQELLPGQCAIIQKDHCDFWHYWQLTDAPWQADFDETCKIVKNTVIDAIERQLVSDVPICTFLSGGLDSSIISALAAKKLKEKNEILHTVSVEYSENEQYFKPSFYQPNRDDYYVQKMSEAIGSVHHSVILDNEEVATALYDAVIARDLPGMVDIDSSLFLFCKEIKKVATVALSGECADEIFGGYPWFQNEEMLNSAYFPWSKDIDYRMSFLKKEFQKQDGKEYVLKRCLKSKEEADIGDFNTEQSKKMKQMMKLNMDWFMQALLDRKDRMSMANGLEVRVPFCDWRLVELLYRIPWEMKNYQGREKGLLREAVKDFVPDEIVWRKKSPYPKTHHPQYSECVKKMLIKIIEDESAPIHQFIDKERLKMLLNEDTAIPWFGQLMTTPQTMAYFVQINFWLKHYHIQIIK